MLTRHTEKVKREEFGVGKKEFFVSFRYFTSLQPNCWAAKATQTPSRHDSQP